MSFTSALVSKWRFIEAREKVEREVRLMRRPHEIREETKRLEARRGKNIFEVMSEDEIARLMEAAPSLMKDMNRTGKDGK